MPVPAVPADAVPADAPQLLYTTAERGLGGAAKGLQVVAGTPGLPHGAAAAAAELSGYRHAGPPDDPANPVVLMHVKMPPSAGGGQVLVRVNEAGRGYTGRQTKLARLAFPAAPLPACGPAAALAAPPFSPGAPWDGVVGDLPPWTPPANRPAGVCKAWAKAGEVGWAGVLAAGVLNRDRAPVALLLPPGDGAETARRALALFAEAIALLPPERRWDATFTTHDGPRPAGVECRWRAALAGSPEADALRRVRGATVLDLTNPAALSAALPTAAALKSAIAAARGGRPLPSGRASAGSSAGPVTGSILDPPPSSPAAAPAQQPAGAPASVDDRPADDAPARGLEDALFEEESDPYADSYAVAPAAPPGGRAGVPAPPPMPGEATPRDGSGRRAYGLSPKEKLTVAAVAATALFLLLIAAGGAWLYFVPEPTVVAKAEETDQTPAEPIKPPAPAPPNESPAPAVADGTSQATDTTKEPGGGSPEPNADPDKTPENDVPENDVPENGDEEPGDREVMVADGSMNGDAALPPIDGSSDPKTTPNPPPKLVHAPIVDPVEGTTLRTVPLKRSIKEILGGPLGEARLWLPTVLVDAEPGLQVEVPAEDGNRAVYGPGGPTGEYPLLEIASEDGPLRFSSARNPSGFTKEQVVRLGSAAIFTLRDAADVRAGLRFWTPLSAAEPRAARRLQNGLLIVPLGAGGEAPAFAQVFDEAIKEKDRPEFLRVVVRLKGDDAPIETAARFELQPTSRTNGKLTATIATKAGLAADVKAIETAADWIDAFRDRLQANRPPQQLGSFPNRAWIPPKYTPKEFKEHAKAVWSTMAGVRNQLNEFAEQVESSDPDTFPDAFPATLRWDHVRKEVVKWEIRPKTPPKEGSYQTELGLEPPGRGENNEPPGPEDALLAAERAYDNAFRHTSGEVLGATFFYRVRPVSIQGDGSLRADGSPGDTKLPPDAHVILLQIGEDPPDVPAVSK